MDHPDGQLAFNEALLRVFVPHVVFDGQLAFNESLLRVFVPHMSSESGSGDFLPCLLAIVDSI